MIETRLSLIHCIYIHISDMNLPLFVNIMIIYLHHYKYYPFKMNINIDLFNLDYTSTIIHKYIILYHFLSVNFRIFHIVIDGVQEML